MFYKAMALIKPIVLPIVSYRDNWRVVQPLRVEAPGISVPITRISYPMGVAGNRKADCHRGLRPIKGMDAWARPKYINIPKLS
ncbi:hypothetical protein DDZ16_20530 [Marinilabilia rubra]|uniref:Uncharacterized protein n=2 Tax=Marinilabilia rubra TaxID=2162893 RepID=A0A2U2B344_9BACT|nr:hypothetical protein DDZ16_20530 [Marinilabilia rubra]